MFKRILVTTDGSVHSEQALPYATELARALGGELLLLHVVPEVDTALMAPMGMPYLPETDPLSLREVGQRLLEQAVSRLNAPQDLPVRPLLKDASHRDVATTIAETARDEQADVIVMASHGRTGLNHMLLGSVAERVMHRSTVPVLLVRQARSVSGVLR